MTKNSYLAGLAVAATALLALSSAQGAVITAYNFNAETLAPDLSFQGLNTTSTDFISGSAGNTLSYDDSGFSSTEGPATSGVFTGGATQALKIARTYDGNPGSDTGWANGGPAANTLGNYVEFTITADSGFFIDLETFSYASSRFAGTPPRNSRLFVQTSKEIDFTQRGFKSLSDTTTLDDSRFLTVDLAGLGSDFTGVSSATFRIVFADDSNNRSGTGFLDNVSLQGTVSAVPEPSTYALLALGGLAFFVYRFRRCA